MTKLVLASVVLCAYTCLFFYFCQRKKRNRHDTRWFLTTTLGAAYVLACVCFGSVAASYFRLSHNEVVLISVGFGFITGLVIVIPWRDLAAIKEKIPR